MAMELAQAILVELCDHKKATHNYLTSTQGQFNWGNTTQEVHKACVRKITTNDMMKNPLLVLHNK